MKVGVKSNLVGGDARGLAMKPCKLVMCPLNFSKGHYYGNGGLTSAVPLLLTSTFVPKSVLEFIKIQKRQLLNAL
jgi:hypothetical protein